MEGITWGDIEMARQDNNARFKVKLEKVKQVNIRAPKQLSVVTKYRIP
ncbi:hypothetical protein [Colwellia psychrerythraea]|nr:hypothetical protein [Colwellia psychrerythraea]